MFLLERALNKLGRLPGSDHERVRDAIIHLGKEPRPQGSFQMMGREACHLRVEKYHVVYEIDDEQQKVTIMDIKQAHDSYQRAF